ncbi:Uncharacterised protein [Burkholderia pseudomallei]|nr:Uncharacterised protein [Burkholderia pseudomallei]
MDSVLNALKDTPVPTILVVAGVFFLLLSVVDKLAGRINVAPDLRKRATLIGLCLLVAGIGLQFSSRYPGTGSHRGTTLRAAESRAASGAATNISPETAQVVPIGSAVHAANRSAADQQYFKFTTPDQPPDQLRVELRDRSKDSAFPWMIVTDENEQEIYNQFRSSGNVVYIFTPHPNTTYFILAKQWAQLVPMTFDIVVAPAAGTD